MIKINFLNSFKDYAGAQAAGAVLFDEDERNLILKEVGKRLAIIALGPIGLLVYELQTIPTLEAKKVDAEKRLAELVAFNDKHKDTAQEIKKYEDEETRFKAQMDFITKIQEDKLNEYKLFRHLKDSTPQTVWVNSLELNENTLTIDGESVDAGDITQFIDKLSNSDFIVNLIPLSQATKANYQNSGSDTAVFQVKATLKSAGVDK